MHLPGTFIQSLAKEVITFLERFGPVFTKGLRLKCGVKVETFVSTKFCLKSYSQRVT